MVEDLAALRIATNNARFREANERIGRVAEEQGLMEQRVPFICECSDPGCVQLVQLPLPEYRRVRGNRRWFIHAPEHELDVPGSVRVVEEHEGYVLVEKVGLAGEVVSDLASDEGSG